MAPEKTSTDDFREILTGVSEVATALLPYCKSTADLIGMLELGQGNDGQLELIMELVARQGQKNTQGPRR